MQIRSLGKVVKSGRKDAPSQGGEQVDHVRAGSYSAHTEKLRQAIAGRLYKELAKRWTPMECHVPMFLSFFDPLLVGKEVPIWWLKKEEPRLRTSIISDVSG